MLDFFYTQDSKQRIIQNIVMEFCERSLEEVLRESEKTKMPIPMETLKNISYQMFSGLEQMH